MRLPQPLPISKLRPYHMTIITVLVLYFCNTHVFCMVMQLKLVVGAVLLPPLKITIFFKGKQHQHQFIFMHVLYPGRVEWKC